LGISAWLILYKTPEENAVTILGLFYVSTFGAVTALAALGGFLARRKFGAREFLTSQLKTSIRQGILIGILFSASLILQSFRLFSWTNSIILLVALISLEFYFLSNERKTFQN
jgi:hypothetical protein